MKHFADLLDRLAYEPRRNAKLAVGRIISHAPAIRTAAMRSPP